MMSDSYVRAFNNTMVALVYYLYEQSTQHEKVNSNYTYIHLLRNGLFYGTINWQKATQPNS